MDGEKTQEVDLQISEVEPSKATTSFIELRGDKDDDKTQIVGGEIISPTAIRAPQLDKGETYAQVRKEAEVGGWLSAITNAKDRPTDVQKLVDAAKATGVPEDVLAQQLKSLNIGITEAKPQASSVNAENKRNKSMETQPVVETVKTREHVLYAPEIKIIPDTHGLSPDFYGINENSEDVVSVGDIIDAPKNLKLRNFNRAVTEANIRRYVQMGVMKAYQGWTEDQIQTEVNRQQSQVEVNNKAASSVDIKRNVQVWTELLKSSKGQLVLGNHELMAMSGLTGNDGDLSNWLLDNNKGKTTLEAFGINTKSIPEVMVDDKDVLTPLNPDVCKNIRQQINKNPELKNFFDLLFSKGKMYTIANEALIVHAGIPLSKSGDLIPPQRKGADWAGFEGTRGLDALDKIEEGIRNRDPNILHWLGSGSSREMSPAWMRTPFFEVMEDYKASTLAMQQLRVQAIKRGADIKIIMVGHTESLLGSFLEEGRVVGGHVLGKYLLGIDTAIGDVVTLDVATQGDVRIESRHRFGQKADLKYKLTKTMP